MEQKYLTAKVLGEISEQSDSLVKHLLTIYIQLSATGEFKSGDLRVESFIKLYSRARTFKFNFDNFIGLVVKINHPDIVERLKTGDLSQDDADHFVQHIYKQNRLDLFIGIFSLFEDAITLLLGAIMTPEEIRELNRFNRSGFITLRVKMEKIATIVGLNNDDLEFVKKFCNTIRNTIHSNAFYHGKPYEYNDEGTIRTFVDGKCPDFMFEPNVLRWVRRLCDILLKCMRGARRELFDFIPDNTTQGSYLIMSENDDS